MTQTQTISRGNAILSKGHLHGLGDAVVSTVRPEFGTLRVEYIHLIECKSIMKRFSGSGTHCLVHDTLTGDTEAERARVRSEALADTLANLPFEDCTDPECDVCVPPA